MRRHGLVTAAAASLAMAGGLLVPPSSAAAIGADTWDHVTTTAVPAVSFGVKIVADPATDQILLLGSAQGDSTLETWNWTGTGWTRLTPASSPPTGGDAAFDPATGQVVLLVPIAPPPPGPGEAAWGDCLPNQTWTWDGSTWTRRFTSNLVDGGTVDSPGGVGQGAMGYDPGSRSLVHVGGICQTDFGSLPTTDTWMWNGSRWTQAANLPVAAGRGAAAGQDPITGAFMLFGGCPGYSPFGADGHTWTFGNGTWTAASTPVAPAARCVAGAALDRVSHRLILFGGALEGGDPATDTWAWDGHAWTQLAPTASPGNVEADNLVTEPTTGRPLLLDADVWRFVSAAPDVVVPSAPLGVTASPRIRAAVVQWSAPATTGGARITRYTVTATPGGRSCSTTGARTCTVTRLTNRVTYRFSVRAATSAGTGPSSVLSTPIVVGTPTAPRVRSVAFPTRTSVRIIWTRPAFTGSGRILRYVVRWSTDNGRTWTRWTSTRLSRTAVRARMRPGHIYLFQVRAVNGSGAGLRAQIRFTQHR